MVRLYKYGFTYKGFLFGWYKKKLHRLPSKSGFNYYPLKELSEIKIGETKKSKGKKGYRIVRDRKSLAQLKELTEVINYEYVINGNSSEDTPF